MATPPEKYWKICNADLIWRRRTLAVLAACSWHWADKTGFPMRFYTQKENYNIGSLSISLFIAIRSMEESTGCPQILRFSNTNHPFFLGHPVFLTFVPSLTTLSRFEKIQTC